MEPFESCLAPYVGTSMADVFRIENVPIDVARTADALTDGLDSRNREMWLFDPIRGWGVSW